MECRSCGASIDYRAAFCSKCGELTQGGQPLGRKLGTGLAGLTHDLGELAKWIMGYVSDEANRKRVIVGGVVIAVLLIVLTENPISASVSSLFASEEQAPQLTEAGLPDFDSYGDVFLSEEAEFVVTGRANVRDFPTSEGTRVIKTFDADEVVRARQVKAFDSDAQWYRLSDGGYIWGNNLIQLGEPADSAGLIFPTKFQGTWSSMDSCRGGDFEYEITIADDHIRFYESLGELKKITHNERGLPLYHLAMSGEGNKWTAVYDIMMTANGFSVILTEVSDGTNSESAYHSADAGCRTVFFTD